MVPRGWLVMLLVTPWPFLYPQTSVQTFLPRQGIAKMNHSTSVKFTVDIHGPLMTSPCVFSWPFNILYSVTIWTKYSLLHIQISVSRFLLKLLSTLMFPIGWTLYILDTHWGGQMRNLEHLLETKTCWILNQMSCGYSWSPEILVTYNLFLAQPLQHNFNMYTWLSAISVHGNNGMIKIMASKIWLSLGKWNTWLRSGKDHGCQTQHSRPPPRPLHPYSRFVKRQSHYLLHGSGHKLWGAELSKINVIHWDTWLSSWHEITLWPFH